jgi:hypothetical protein
VVVCSRLYGMALAYSLNEAHVGDHCERVGAQPGMRMALPFKLLPSSKDKELRSIVPRPFPPVGLDPSATDDEQVEGGDNRNGGDFGGYGSDDRDIGWRERNRVEGRLRVG